MIFSLLLLIAGTENTVALAKKHKLKVAFGTDVLFSTGLALMPRRVGRSSKRGALGERSSRSI